MPAACLLVPDYICELLMTQNIFFRQSLFHFEEDSQEEHSTNKNILTPWTQHEEVPLHISKKSKPPFPAKEHLPKLQKKEAPNLASNLLPQSIPKSKQVYLVHKLPSVQLKPKKSKHKSKSKGMPIQQFLSQKRQQKRLEEALHRKSIAIISESLESSFLAKRSIRKKMFYGSSQTIDLKRDSLSPLHVYRSQQVVDISPQKLSSRKEYSMIMEKYLPIRSERYQL